MRVDPGCIHFYLWTNAKLLIYFLKFNTIIYKYNRTIYNTIQYTIYTIGLLIIHVTGYKGNRKELLLFPSN